jgi:hypothetical protein
LAYRLSTRKTTILSQKYEIPGLHHSLKHKGKLRKLWQETRAPACKTGSKLGYSYHENGPEKSTWKRGKKLANCEVIPQAIHGPLGPIFYPIEKANIIADYLENQFRVNNLCDSDHRRHVEATVKALLATVDEDIPVNFWPCDVSKEIQSLKFGMVCGFDGIPNECLWHLPRRPLVHLTRLLNHYLPLGHFLAPWNVAKIGTLPNPRKNPNFPQNLCLISPPPE